MNRTNQTIRYLAKSYKWMFINGAIVMLGTVILADVIYFRTGGYDLSRSAGTQIIELTAGVFTFLIGALYFRPNFRVALANGISRKTFMLANLPVAALTSLVFALYNFAIVSLHKLIWPVTSTGGTQFSFTQNWIWSIILHIVLYFMLIISGWFFTFIYYRSNTFMKWVITLTGCLVFFSPVLFGQEYYLSIQPAIRDFVLWCFYRPERSPIVMLALSAVLYEITFLLIHRAPLKD